MTRTCSTPSVQMEIVLACDVIIAMPLSARHGKGALIPYFMRYDNSIRHSYIFH